MAANHSEYAERVTGLITVVAAAGPLLGELIGETPLFSSIYTTIYTPPPTVRQEPAVSPCKVADDGWGGAGRISAVWATYSVHALVTSGVVVQRRPYLARRWLSTWPRYSDIAWVLGGCQILLLSHLRR